MSLTINGTTLTGTSCVNYNSTPVTTIWACNTSNATCCKVWSKYSDTENFYFRVGDNAVRTDVETLNQLYNNGGNSACCNSTKITCITGFYWTVCLSSLNVTCVIESTNENSCYIICGNTTSDTVGNSYDIYVNVTGSNFRVYNKCGNSSCGWSPECLVRSYGDTVTFNWTKCLTNFTVDATSFYYCGSASILTYKRDISDCFTNLSCISFDNASQQLVFDQNVNIYLVRCDGLCIPQYSLCSCLVGGYIVTDSLSLRNKVYNSTIGSTIGTQLNINGCYYGNNTCIYECATCGCL